MAKSDINELSNKTLASYMKHAGHDVAKREADRAKRKSDFEAAGNGLYKIDGMTSTHHNDLRNKAYSFRQEINKADRDDDLATQKKVWKRTIGIRKAENRIGGETPADREAAKAARKAALAAHLKAEQDRKDRAAARAAKKKITEEINEGGDYKSVKIRGEWHRVALSPSEQDARDSRRAAFDRMIERGTREGFITYGGKKRKTTMRVVGGTDKDMAREESKAEKQTLLDVISEGDVESLYAALDLAVRARINEALFGEEEDAEDVEEDIGEVNELSRNTVGSYIKKAGTQVVGLRQKQFPSGSDYSVSPSWDGSDDQRKMGNRLRGINAASKKIKSMGKRVGAGGNVRIGVQEDV